MIMNSIPHEGCLVVKYQDKWAKRLRKSPGPGLNRAGEALLLVEQACAPGEATCILDKSTPSRQKYDGAGGLQLHGAAATETTRNIRGSSGAI